MEISEAINEFYKLKNEYEEKKQAKINNILRDESLKTMKQKRIAFNKIKLPCVGCDKLVGTNFSIKDGVLMASCGDINNSCGLNIKINRGKYILINDLIDTYNDDLQENNEKIIQIKLDLLFNFKSESLVLDTFKDIRDEIANDLETLNIYKTQYVSTLSNLDNKNEINNKMIIFYNLIDTIKNTVKEFNETGNEQLIKDVISIYNDQLEPILKALQKLKYKYEAIEYNNDDKTYCLQRKIYTLNEMVIPFDVDAEIVQFDLARQ
jgi:hypothetical protein